MFYDGFGFIIKIFVIEVEISSSESIRLQHVCICNIQIYFCNIQIKHLYHTSKNR